VNTVAALRYVRATLVCAVSLQINAVIVAAHQSAPAAASETSTYTTQQAEAGKVAYEANCAGCHRSDFQGEQDAKPLAGGTFLNAWRGRTSDDLFDYISRAMPPTTPGSAGDEDNLNIVAYLLQANKVAAGTVPLGYESAVAIPAAASTSDKR
jgi:S-disulfanyl-L-cysteine oxidoreductase SoxD